MEIEVRRPGLQTTVQDLGRPGFRAAGVPLGGAMDRFALRLANVLVGNAEDAPALEFALLGPELVFSRPAMVAVTGGDFGVGPLNHPFEVAARQVLSFSSVRRGARGYLAVAGGFEVPRVLGSAATYLRAGFGGHEGRELHTGDVLRVPNARRIVEGHWHVDPGILPRYGTEPEVRVVRGAHADEFVPVLFGQAYRVSSQSDRMGFRLQGPPLTRPAPVEIRSTTVVPGTVQVPPDGQPIVLMADAQTLGGYPQAGHVITADLPVVAQLRPGDALRFRAVSVREAREAALAQEHGLAMLRTGLAAKFR